MTPAWRALWWASGLALWASSARAETLTSSVAAPSPVRFVPAQPRLGDLLLVYVHEDRAHVEAGGLSAFLRAVELVRVSATELRGVVAVPIDATPGPHEIRIELPDGVMTATLMVLDRPFETDTLTVDKRFTRKPDKALQKRLEAEERSWSALFQPLPGPGRHLGRFLRPVPGAPTAPYGVRRIFNGRTKSRHYGLDLDGKTGDPILAAGSGVVVMSELRFAAGGTVVVDHGGGLFTAYFHMSKRLAQVGQWVTPGTLLGAVGQTGRVTGPHLHFSVMARMAGEERADGWFVDPAPVLSLVLQGEPEYLEREPAPARGAGTGG